MTEKERFQRAFAPLHASPDTMTEVMKMTERKTKRPALRRAATIGLAAALVLALGSVAYASDLGGIQRTVQLWLNGEMTDATLTVNEGSYTLRYPDKDGTEHEMGGGGIAIEDDGTERALTEEEMLEHLNAPEVVYEMTARSWSTTSTRSSTSRTSSTRTASATCSLRAAKRRST